MDLPAFSFVHPPEQPRPKPQNLDFVDGYPDIKPLNYRTARAEPLDVTKGYPNTVSPPRRRVTAEHDGTQENYDNSGACYACSVPNSGPQPQWLKYDRQVLRYFAYFKEGISERRDENWRVRKCTIYYYLADGMIHVGEPKQDNSGIAQGVFLKKCKVPNGKGGSIGIEDFQLGSDVTMFGHTYRICSCDEFTRRYLLRYGYVTGTEEGYPGEPLESYRDCLKKVYRTRIKEFPAKQFLESDGKVLRFFCMWDDRENLYGVRHPHILHYFLGDDTIEITEVRERNNGMHPFPKLLRRQKLPKEVPSELLEKWCN